MYTDQSLHSSAYMCMFSDMGGAALLSLQSRVAGQYYKITTHSPCQPFPDSPSPPKPQCQTQNLDDILHAMADA
jgi:hypothetical protein